MEVACPQCAARYAFDDAAIPAEGYDAQCTNCSTVFFVKPPAAEASVPAVASAPVAPAPLPPVPELPDSFAPAPIEVPAASPIPVVPEEHPAAATFTPEPVPPTPEPVPPTPEPMASVPVAPVVPDPQPEPTSIAPQATTQGEPSPAAHPQVHSIPVVDADAIPVAEADAIPLADADAIPLGAADTVDDPHRRGTAKMEPMAPVPSPEPMAMELTPTVPIGSVDEPVLLQEPGPSPVQEPVPGAGSEFVESVGTLTEPEAIELAAAEPVAAEPAAVEPADIDPLAPDPLVSDPGFDDYDDPDSSANDMMAIAAELGEPVEAPDGASPETDFETIMRRRRKRGFLVVGAVAVVVLYTVGTYALLPQVFDSTVGPLIAVKAAVHPDAIPLKEAGLRKMLEDTQSAYDEAEASLNKALEIDDQYPDAIALAALVHVFRGSDIQDKGRAVQSEGNALVAEMSALNDAEKKPKGTEKRMAELRKKVDEINGRAAQYFEKGGDELRKAMELLGPALEDHSDSAMVVFASGIYMTTDPDRHRQARQRLTQGMDRLVAPGTELDLDNPQSMWPAYLQARAHSGPGGQKDLVVKSYQAALKKEPGFNRAKYQLASHLWTSDKREPAKGLLSELIEAAPEHQRAKTLLAEVSKSPPELDPAAAHVEEPSSTPAKKKGKRRRRRRRR